MQDTIQSPNLTTNPGKTSPQNLFWAFICIFKSKLGQDGQKIVLESKWPKKCNFLIQCGLIKDGCT